MNIFRVSDDPVEAAKMLCDSHVNKMTVESAQMLSTAHRMLDGVEIRMPSKSGKRMVKYYKMQDDYFEQMLYKAVHFNHPSTVWTRESRGNYAWHYRHFIALCEEFEYRFGKVHATYEKLGSILSTIPKNIPMESQTPFKLAMAAYPQLLTLDPVTAYREFYKLDKVEFAKWERGRPAPKWWTQCEA